MDGLSTDRTREILEAYGRKHSRLRVLINSERTAPTALNKGIAASQADVIVRVDGHCELAPDYIERCVDLLAATRAANVGGLMNPRSTSRMGRAIALATQSRVGIGNARFHYLQKQEYVDTVYLGAFRREVLEEVGGYDEELTRNQDDELNYRIRRAGYGIVLSPAIVSTYVPRSSLRSLWRQYFQYGWWKVRVIEKHPASVQPRHLAPAFFTAGSLGSLLLAALTRRSWPLTPIAAYALLIGSVAARLSRRDVRLFALLVLVFPTLHFGYGSGFLIALFDRRTSVCRSIQDWVRLAGRTDPTC